MEYVIRTDLRTGRAERLDKLAPYPMLNRLRFSPDGHQLAALGEARVSVMNTHTQTVVTRVPLTTDELPGVGFDFGAGDNPCIVVEVHQHLGPVRIMRDVHSAFVLFEIDSGRASGSLSVFHRRTQICLRMLGL